jgi:MinD-like ATPase involved in chromosome partitioning or flagellar assembly
MRHKRIIPVSSGKGGVGKTTFALNYALCLSRHGRTVLVDLDTGTSSVRTCVDTPVARDLYHFFKRGQPLGECITPLDARLDPQGLYRNFGFVAGPKHMIEDITNFDRRKREQLIDAINALPADFVVLDLKAGLDENVIAFLPFSNSGILIFTPHLPAATLAASDIVKAILFRKLRGLFAEGSHLYSDLKGLTPAFVNGLLDRVEDVYDESVPNLDGFVEDLRHALGDHPVVRFVAEAIDSFVVHYVLNLFNGVRDSYDSAIKPFVRNLEDNVSAHLTLFNLGWVVTHEEIVQASIERVPALLYREMKPAGDAASQAPALALERLAKQYLPRSGARRAARPPAPATQAGPRAAKASPYLNAQLDTLVRMHADLQGVGYRDNFRYIAERSLHILTSRRVTDFGGPRLYKEAELREAFRLPVA